MKRWSLARLVAWSVIGAACQGGVRDSSGDDRADQPAVDFFAAAKVSFRLAPEPLVVVGLDEALPLEFVRAAFFLGDDIVIADGGPTTSEILFLDEDGQLLRRQGRLGEGPGEYRFLAGLSRYRDGLAAWDGGLLRLSILDAEGNHLSSTRIHARSHTWLVGAVGDNVLFHWADPGFSGEGAVGPREVRLDEEFRIVRASDGEVIREITLAGLEKWVRRKARVNGSFSHGGPGIIFGRAAVAAVIGGRAYLGTTDSLALTVYDRDGNASFLSMKHSPIAAQPEWERFVRDSLREAIEARGASPLPPMDDGRNVGLVMKQFMLEGLEGLPARSTLPAYSAIKGGADGRLWIREFPNPLQERAAWIGVSQSGQRQRRLEIPMGLEVMDISDRRVIVSRRGPFREHVVEVYAMEPDSIH